jgi:MFS family permease
MSKSSNVHLYIAASIACLTASLFGYSVGFIGGVLVLPSFLRSFHLNKLPPHELASVESRIVTLWLLGALFGVPLGMPVCSRFGRKSCLLLSALLYVLGAAMQLASPNGNLGVFEAGRLLNGLGVGAGTLASPI